LTHRIRNYNPATRCPPGTSAFKRKHNPEYYKTFHQVLSDAASIRPPTLNAAAPSAPAPDTQDTPPPAFDWAISAPTTVRGLPEHEHLTLGIPPQSVLDHPIMEFPVLTYPPLSPPSSHTAQIEAHKQAAHITLPETRPTDVPLTRPEPDPDIAAGPVPEAFGVTIRPLMISKPPLPEFSVTEVLPSAAALEPQPAAPFVPAALQPEPEPLPSAAAPQPAAPEPAAPEAPAFAAEVTRMPERTAATPLPSPAPAVAPGVTMETLKARPNMSATPDGLPINAQIISVMTFKSAREEGLYLGVNLATGARVLAYDTRTDNGVAAGTYLFDCQATSAALSQNPLMNAINTWCSENNADAMADVIFHYSDQPFIESIYHTLFEPRIVRYQVRLPLIVTRLQHTTTELNLPENLSEEEVLEYARQAWRTGQGEWDSNYVMNVAPTVLLDERPDLEVTAEQGAQMVQRLTLRAAPEVERVQA